MNLEIINKREMTIIFLKKKKKHNNFINYYNRIYIYVYNKIRVSFQ